MHHRRGEWALAEERFRAALDATTELAARARIVADLSLTAHDGGDAERAAALAGEALELAEQAGEPRALGQAHNLLGVLEGSLAHLFPEPRPGGGRRRRRGSRGGAQQPRARPPPARRLPRALELTRAALALCIEIGDRHREAALRNNLADLLHATGRSADAMEELKPSVTIFAEIGAEGPHPAVWKLARW